MPGAPTYDLQRLPSGRTGTIRTLRAMQQLVREAVQRPEVIEAAHNVVRRVPERDDVATMRAMLEDVRRRMRYTRDPIDVELVKAPWVVINRTGGSGFAGPPEPMDCDDAATLLGAMLGAVGIPTRFRVVGTDPSRPKDFSHVYVAARASDGAWHALDPIVRGKDVGWQVPDGEATLRGSFGVNGLGCPPGRRSATCSSAARCRMESNRMNGRNGADFGGFGGTGGVSGLAGQLGLSTDDVKSVLEKTIDDYLRKKYGGGKGSSAAPPTVPPPPRSTGGGGGGEFVQTWLNPWVNGQLNMRAVLVLGGGAAALWYFQKGGGRRRRR